MKNIQVKYIHPEKTILVSVNNSYSLGQVRALCEKYNTDYKTYFMPVDGEWKDYEPKPKRKYTKKKDKEENING